MMSCYSQTELSVFKLLILTLTSYHFITFQINTKLWVYSKWFDNSPGFTLGSTGIDI